MNYNPDFFKNYLCLQYLVPREELDKKTTQEIEIEYPFAFAEYLKIKR